MNETFNERYIGFITDFVLKLYFELLRKRETIISSQTISYRQILEFIHELSMASVWQQGGGN